MCFRSWFQSIVLGPDASGPMHGEAEHHGGV
jgi:hypothetical protein